MWFDKKYPRWATAQTVQDLKLLCDGGATPMACFWGCREVLANRDAMFAHTCKARAKKTSKLCHCPWLAVKKKYGTNLAKTLLDLVRNTRALPA